MGLFQPATKSASKARIAITGPSGSGKTFTALAVATGLADGGKLAVIDTERGSAAKYADLFTFDHAVMSPPYLHGKYIKALEEAAQEGYAVALIDSLTHAWKGRGGLLEQVDDAKQKRGNDFTAWAGPSKAWQDLLDAILESPIHVIATMRSKQDYILEANDRGKQVPRKVGMAPEARDGVEYEFDVVFDMDLAHTATVSKSRCAELSDAQIAAPGREVGERLLGWLSDPAQAVGE